MSTLGPHATFIVGSYAVATTVITALLIWVVADYRVQRRTLADLEQRGFGRRSAGDTL
ncbi:heme exporter protein D, CcmD [Variibacter gotjawalensis]|uniref:Heme exporter protein D n=1 Tax=Variibacter gotjawalensis TaxID=1333996 RepID=A0A0S3PRT6_9BRAD|nr:heme exporter protein CcmD [Variibacter gotjawalensis]NIK48972.1 heme exporter protein D [Variibacter gotjawalensis]RZS50828.1 heme exporter protein D [Variibacter gotjawalensis]BAT58662.1 heme exporter protein D, CcmD [Variibacter gotjawalensis]